MSKKRQSRFNGYGRGQIRILSWDYRPDDRVPPHTHDWHQLVYAISGVMTIQTADSSWVVPTQRAVWVPARIIHAIEMSGQVSMRTLYVSPRLRRNLPGDCRVVSVPPLLRELLLHAVAVGGLDRRVARQRAVMDVLLDQIAELPPDPLRVPQVREPRAAAIARRIVDDPGDRRSLAELARGSGGSKRTIERAFRSDTGMTFGTWRQHVRLLHAVRLLGAGQPVTAVALDVGYDSVSAFVHRFRCAFGTTPGRYFPSR